MMEWPCTVTRVLNIKPRIKPQLSIEFEVSHGEMILGKQPVLARTSNNGVQ